jgi:glycosyltransferase involved in cell wall biosynthesis
VHVLLVSSEFFPRSVGGGEVQVCNLARQLLALGHQVTVMTFEGGQRRRASVAYDSFEGIRVARLGARTPLSPYARPRGLVRWLTAWLRREQVEVVHLFLWRHLLAVVAAAAALDLPVVLTALDFGYFCRRYNLMRDGSTLCALDVRGAACEACTIGGYSTRQKRFARYLRAALPERGEWLVRTLARNLFGRDILVASGGRTVSRLIEQQRSRIADELSAVIVPSSIMRTFYVAHGADPRLLRSIPYIIERPEPAAVSWQPQDGVLRLAFVGRLDPAKGLHTLIEARRRVDVSTRVLLDIWSPFETGPAPYVAQLRAATANDPDVRWRGGLDRPRLPQIYQQTDVLVVPSLWLENSPVTIGEAFAHGCPVVASRMPGTLDLVRDGVNGILVSPGDPAALAAAIRQLARVPGLSMKLRAGVVPPRAPEDVASEILQLYDEAAPNVTIRSAAGPGRSFPLPSSSREDLSVRS